jgi:hypothetical protein
VVATISMIFYLTQLLQNNYLTILFKKSKVRKCLTSGNIRKIKV